jgi:hypothetical protein
MQNLPTKSTGDQYTAAEFNVNQDERENAVTDSGQTLGGDDFQLSRAMSVNAAGADYYDDSGVADAYVLSKPGTSSLRSPPAYFEGMLIRFRPTNNNTGASTVNVAAIDVVDILKEDGATALSSGDLSTVRDAHCRYDISAGAFLLKSDSPEATKTSKGILYLGDQRIILSNNGTDDIDFSGGRFSFSDGTGQEIIGALTKQLDTVFTAGNNQGGLDVLPKSNNTWYHCFAVFNPTTGVKDYAFSLSASGPTQVGNLVGFTKSRRIGSIRTGGGAGAILGFIQSGKLFRYTVRIADLIGTTFVLTAVSLTVTAPANIETKGLFNVSMATTGLTNVLFTSLDETDSTPSNNLNSIASSSGTLNNIEFLMKTTSSATPQIRYRSDNTGAAVRFLVQTLGWEDFTLED